MRKSLAVSVSAALLLAVSLFPVGMVRSETEGQPPQGAEAARTLSGGEQLASENAGYLFYIAPDTGTVRVVSRTDGTAWRSNPEAEEIDADPVARNIYKMRLKSQIFIEYLDDKNKLQEANSFTGSVADGNLTVQQAGEVVLCNYFFASAQLNIPVFYRLTDTGLSVWVDYRSIIERGAHRLTRVSLLPYFGAGSSSDQGYMVIPDGSGAVVGFNNRKFSQGPLTLPLYGGDATVTGEKYVQPPRDCLLPMYGISRNGAGCLAAAVSGEAGGRIVTTVAGKETSYNHTYFEFSARHYDTTTLLNRTWAANAIILHSEQFTDDMAKVEYRFTQDSGLTGLAAEGRAILEKQGLETNGAPGELPLFLDVYAGVSVYRQFLGLKYKTVEPLTTFSQLEEMLDELTAEGVLEFRVRLNGVDSDGAYYGKIDTKLKFSSKLGGKRGYDRLAKDFGGQIYPAAELVMFTKNGNGVFSFFHSVTGITGKTAELGDYKLSTGLRDAGAGVRYLLRPQKVKASSEKLLRNVKKQGVSALSLSSISNTLYSSYSRADYEIGATKAVFSEVLAACGKELSLLLDAPAAWAIPSADCLINLPTTSSGHYIEDYTVPFLQLVLDGSVPYSTQAVNLFGSFEDVTLMMIESNSAPCFSVMNADYDKVSDTELRELYSSSYHYWKEDMISLYQQMAQVRKATEGSRIRRYEVLTPDVRKITFGNGAAVYVNYSDQLYHRADVQVPAHSYQVAEVAP
jgi:hypothetical protein